MRPIKELLDDLENIFLYLHVEKTPTSLVSGMYKNSSKISSRRVNNSV